MMRMESIDEEEHFGIVPFLNTSSSTIAQNSEMISDCFFGSDTTTATLSPIFRRRSSFEIPSDVSGGQFLASGDCRYQSSVVTTTLNSENGEQPQYTSWLHNEVDGRSHSERKDSGDGRVFNEANYYSSLTTSANVANSLPSNAIDEDVGLSSSPNDLQPSWIEEWMDINGIFDPSNNMDCSDIGNIADLCPSSTDSQSSANVEMLSSLNKIKQPIATTTIPYSHNDEQPSHYIVMHSPTSSLELLNCDNRSIDPSSIPHKHCVEIGPEVSPRNEKSEAHCLNEQLTASRNEHKKLTPNSKSFILRPVSKETFQQLSPITFNNEQTRRSVRVMKASQNIPHNDWHHQLDEHIDDISSVVSSNSPAISEISISNSSSSGGSSSSRSSNVLKHRTSSGRRTGSPYISERKREQNRCAAVRYREKRREEAKRKKEELHEQELRNVELKTQVAGLSKEIAYLKSILNEVLQH